MDNRRCVEKISARELAGIVMETLRIEQKEVMKERKSEPLGVPFLFVGIMGFLLC